MAPLNGLPPLDRVPVTFNVPLITPLPSHVIFPADESVQPVDPVPPPTFKVVGFSVVTFAVVDVRVVIVPVAAVMSPLNTISVKFVARDGVKPTGCANAKTCKPAMTTHERTKSQLWSLLILAPF